MSREAAKRHVEANIYCQYPKINTRQLQNSSNKFSENITNLLANYKKQLANIENQNRTLISSQLSNLVSEQKYPSKKIGFIVATGSGPTLITVDVMYSGIPRFLGIFKSRFAIIKMIIHYGPQMEELEINFPVSNKEDNSEKIAGFLKSAILRIYQIINDLNNRNPLYDTISNFESELVLKVSEILVDPSVAAIYVHMNNLQDCTIKYEQEVQALIQEIKDKKIAIEKELESLSQQIIERQQSIDEEVKKNIGIVRNKLDKHLQEKITKIDAAMERDWKSKLTEIECKAKNKKANAEIEARRIIQDVEKEKRKCEGEVSTLKLTKQRLEQEIQFLQNSKGNINKDTQAILEKLDRIFVDYYQRDPKKNPKENVTPILRAKCAKQIAEIIGQDKSLNSQKIFTIIDYIIKKVKRSAGNKFNGQDLVEIVDIICWMIKTIKYDYIIWFFNRSKWTASSVNECRKQLEALLETQEGKENSQKEAGNT